MWCRALTNNYGATMKEKQALLMKFNKNWRPYLHPIAMEGFPNSEEELRSLLDSYIEEVPVRCLSPRDLLAEVHVQPEMVVHLKIDAEGYDAILLNHFLELKGFAPAIMQFEWEWSFKDNG